MTDSSPTFAIGEFISGDRDGEKCTAVVLDKSEESGELLLLWLTDHQCEEVATERLAGWQRGAVPDARWVEVYEGDAQEPFFSGYLPTFQAALAVHKTFQERDGDFRV